MNILNTITGQIQILSQLLKSQNATMATAESCTGGLVSVFCTDMAGSSKWFYATVVTYDNRSKVELLGVLPNTLDKYGAVSHQVVAQMCAGLLKKTPVNYVIAISGVAGPSGGSKINPVGSVYIGVQKRNKRAIIDKYYFAGDRENIRYNAVTQALDNLIKLAKG